MDDARRSGLLKKRKELKYALEAQDFISQRVEPFSEILRRINAADIRYEIYLMQIPLEWESHLQKLMNENRLADFKYGIVYLPEKIQLLDQMLLQFPSIHPLRYVPDLPRILGDQPISQMLKSIVDELRIAKQQVFVCYLQYAVLLQIELDSFIKIANEDMINFWHGDMIIFPAAGDWLISWSMEEQWYAGRSQ